MSQISFSELLDLPYQAPDQVISYGESEFQYAEYWRPATEKPVPLVILIHGGCWLNAYGAKHIRPLASKLKERGYAAWSVEYRRVGDVGGGWTGSFDDILESINKARDLDTIDFTNVFIMGHSAGGHLALWAATLFSENSPFANRLRLKIKGVVGLAAITNLVEYAAGSSSCERATPKLLGGTPNNQMRRYELTSPHLLSLASSAILIHGEADSTVNIRQSTQLSAAAKNVSLISQPGLGHFDLINPEGQAFDQILYALQKLRK